MAKLKYYSKYSDNRIQRKIGNINVDFFKTWSSQMAYVLGYFCADGCMFVNSGGSKYIFLFLLIESYWKK